MAQESLPGQEEQSEEAVCSQCGCYVGPLNSCRHCGAPRNRRMSLRIFRWAAVLLATVGLGILYLMSIMKDVPRIAIGDIKETMNFAYVHIEGTVPASARVYKDGDVVSSVSFSVDDGTGVIRVKAYRKKARLLMEAAKVPRAGERVALDGSLNVSADRTALYLQVPEKMEIVGRVEREQLRIEDIAASKVGSVVRVTGTIEDLKPPRGERHPWTWELKDDTGGIRVAMWQNVKARIVNEDMLKEGASVELTPEVTSYRGKVQLQVNNPDDIRFLPRAADAKNPAGKREG